MTARTGQKSAALLLLLLSIFLALLARNAVASVRQRVEPLEGDLLAAAVAAAEGLGGAVQPAQRLVDVPEEAPLLAREEERLLALHRVRALVGHVEGVAAQLTGRALRRGPEGLVVVTELLEHAAALLLEALLEVRELLLRERLELLGR